MSMEIHSQGVVEVVDSHELTAEERAEVDYLDWAAIDEGCDSATFFRLPNHPDDVPTSGPTTLYDLGEFSADFGITKGSGLPYEGWHGYLSDSAFSAMLVKYVDDGDGDEFGHVEVARLVG